MLTIINYHINFIHYQVIFVMGIILNIKTQLQS